jgi:RNA polymerase sigma-70 factor (ECF subfamily)
MSPGVGDDGHSVLLLAVARDRDRQAFATLFAHFAPRVKFYLQKTGEEAGAAEEMAQEVLLAVWRKASQYDPHRATVSAWIFGIARNRRIDSRRRRRPELRVPDPSQEPPPVALADATLLADEAVRRMRTALGSLPPDQMKILQLAFFEDRSHTEINRLLGVPLGTVKSRLRLALLKLRAALKDDA